MPTPAPSSAPIAVTGASGYVGSWVVRELLSRGANVHATVRDPSRADRVDHLRRAAEGLPGTLTLFAADLLDEGSFDAAFRGCNIVVHTASPFFISSKDPQRDFVDPALQGTRNVLASVNRTPSVERVVLTSSIVAIVGDNADAPNGRADEAMWNTTSSLTHNPYSFSKTVAERDAWTMHDAQSRWRLVVINPGFVLGPSLSPRSDSTSIDFVVKLLDGTRRSGVPRSFIGFVDVRDVAFAHAEAAFRPDASGRHIICGECTDMATAGRYMAGLFPGRPIPKRPLPDVLAYIVGPLVVGWSLRYIRRNIGVPITFDNARSRERLGMSYRPLRETLRDHGEQVLRDGLA